MKYRVAWLMAVFSLVVMSLLAFFALVRPVRAADLIVGVSPGCSTIQGCINTAVPGDNVIIPANTYVESLTLNKAVSLVGAGSESTTIQAVSGERVLTVTGATINSSVVISGLRLQNGDVSSGNLCSSLNTANCGGGILITGSAAPSLSNLIIQNNSAFQGGGLYADVGTVLPPLNNVAFLLNAAVLSGGGAYFVEGVIVNNGRFENNASLNNVAGGARFGGDTIINNTLFSGNTATCTSIIGICHAGGLYGFEMNLTVNDSRFENNRCQDPFNYNCDGGGLYWSRSFNGPYSVMINNTDFINNEAGRNGGGLMAASNFFVDETQVSGGRFEGNVAVTGDGGAIQAARLVMSGTQILTNTAGGYSGVFSEGGAVNTIYTTTITNSIFSGNQSGDRGGALVGFSGPVTIDSSTFFSNTARDNGGAVYVQIAGADIRNSRIEANRVLTTVTSSLYGQGGGIWVAGNLSLVNTDVMSNMTRWRGGGVYASLTGGGQVSVINGRFEANSTLDWVFSNDGGGGLYVVNGSGTTTVSATTFISNKAAGVGGGMYAFGPVNLLGGHVEANESLELSGGGLFVAGAFTASGNSQFVNNRANFSGGGLLIDDTAAIEDAIFTGNEVDGGSGGAIYVSEQLMVSDTQFINNRTAGFSGGGISALGVTMVTNSLFQDNMSAGSGGGLAGSFNPVTVVDSHFVNNTAVGNGAGLSSAGNLFITNNLFQQNQATTGNGGGLYTSGSVVVTNTTFMENRAAVDGGGAYINSNSTFISGTFSNNQSLNGSGGGLYGNSAVTADNTQFINNDAGLDGGGLHSRFGRATLTHVTIKNNSAQRSGGGVSIGRFVTLSATMILSNTADLGGGVAISSTFDGPTENHVVNVLLARNQAASDGDALYHNLNRTLNVIHTTIANPTQSANQAIYVISGTVNVVNTIIANHGIGIEAAASGSATADFVNYFDNGTNEVGLSGTNLTTGNPLFVNAAADDYRLAVGSASLENGTNAGIDVDIRGVVRPIGSGFDRGAYEGTHTPTAVTLNTFTAKTVTTAWLWILLSLLLTVVSFTGYKRKP